MWLFMKFVENFRIIHIVSIYKLSFQGKILFGEILCSQNVSIDINSVMSKNFNDIQFNKEYLIIQKK